MALKLKHDGKDIEVRFGHVWQEDITPETIPLFMVRPTQPNHFVNRRCSIADLSINGEPFARGIAICHPQDNFSRTRGRKIALTKAIEPLDKLTRRAIWETYKRFMKI